MTPNLYLTPSIDTAVRHLRGRIQALREEDFLYPVTVLAPTAGVLEHLRAGLSNTMGIRLTQFYRFAQHLLAEAGNPVHELNDFAIRKLVRMLLRRMHEAGELSTFDPLWEMPGMTEVLLDWLREMKSQGIWPEHYADHARTRQDPRDQQLAVLYTAYQDFLIAREYSDADGLLWLAAESLEEGTHSVLRDEALFVIGFDQFPPVQLRILRQLAGRCEHFGLYLQWDPSRPPGDMALARLLETRNALNEAVPFHEETLPEDASTVEAGLASLQRSLFLLEAETRPASGAVRFIEAPSREAEVRQALRAVKALLLEGVPAGEITVLMPSPQTYRPIAAAVAGEYGLPLTLDQRLTDTPVVMALTNLLGLAPDFPWLETLDALRSPYIRQPWLSPEQIDRLDRLSREKPVLAGREQWKFALRPLVSDEEAVDDEDLAPDMQVGLLSEQDLAAIAEGLEQFFNHLTPPESGSAAAYVHWIQTRLLGLVPDPGEGEGEVALESEPGPSLQLLDCCLDTDFEERDVGALQQVNRALRSQAVNAALLDPAGETTWESYREELLQTLGIMRVANIVETQGVRFEPLEAGRARPVDYLFVLGLSEGEFPHPPAPDVFYSPAEREAHPLPLIRYNPLHDTTLWWQVVSSCRRRLTLLRPYIDENGAPWESSPYWEATAVCIEQPQVTRVPIAALPAVEDSASQGELLMALARRGGALSVPDALQPLWCFAAQADGVMRQRSGTAPAGNFEGVLADESVRAELADIYGPACRWSPSRLNRYAVCPYGFFAEHVLKLDPLLDPQEGFDALQRGSLLHVVLEGVFRRLTQEGLDPTPDSLPQVLDCLEEVCRAEFAAAPLKYGFRPGALWRAEQAELKRLLAVLLEWECDKNRAGVTFRPYLQEVYFGLKNGYPALEVEINGTCFRVGGVIDRVDRRADGALRVIDYKSGSSSYSKRHIEEGTALQTVLYALAAGQCLGSGDGGQVAESAYLHIPSRKFSGELTFQGELRENVTLEEGLRQAAQHIRNVRAGVFLSAPADPQEGSTSCRQKCEFAPICRVSRESLRKARRGGTDVADA